MSDAGITLTEAPATPAHRHAALIACLAFAAVTALFAPFATAAWPNVPAFIPAYQMLTAFCYALTAWLMFGAYRQGGRPSTLVLAAGSLWTALILVAQLLSVPGMAGPARLIGGEQTTIHLWMWWHLGPPLFALLFAGAHSRFRGDAPDADQRRTASTLAFTGAAFAFFGVYGFVKQSGGNATLESTPGAGTTVTLTLPKDAPSALPGETAGEGGQPARLLSLIRREAAD